MTETLQNYFEEYKEKVNQFIAEDSSKIFGNYSKRHTRFITERFVSIAEKNVILLAGSLTPVIYDAPVQTAFRQCAEHLHHNGYGGMRILTFDNQPAPEWLTTLADQFPDEVKFRTCLCKVKAYHFLIVDDKRYRLEEPHETLGGKTDEEIVNIKAEVCCNGPVKSAKLTIYFDRLWNLVG